MMQAVILCRNPKGFPGPMLARRPVFLMPVGDKPLGQHMVEKLFESGIKDIILAAPDSPYEISAYFGDGTRFGESINRIPLRPGMPSLTCLNRLGDDLSENFLFFEYPMLTDADLGGLAKLHLECGSPLTWYGGQGLACLNREAFFKAGGKGELSDLAEHFQERAVLCELGGKKILEIEGLNAFHAANQAWLQGLSPFPSRETQLAQLARGCEVHPTARLVPPYYLGPHCVLGKQAKLGPNACVGEGCILDDGSESYDCVICENTYLGRDTTASNCVADQGILARVPKGRVTVVPDRFILGPVTENSADSCPFWDLMQRFLAVFGLLVYLPLLGYLWTAGRIKRQRVAGRLRQEDLSGTLSFTTLTIHVWKGRRGLAKYIPALWDVARGKLHLVGSEPLKPAAAHPLLQSWEQPRFSRLPGLVNPWHATSNPYPYEFEKRATEVYYAKTRTPAQDFKILLSSLPSLWKKEPTREEQRDY